MESVTLGSACEDLADDRAVRVIGPRDLVVGPGLDLVGIDKGPVEIEHDASDH
jgi:hypothetical protein